MRCCITLQEDVVLLLTEPKLKVAIFKLIFLLSGISTGTVLTLLGIVDIMLSNMLAKVFNILHYIQQNIFYVIIRPKAFAIPD